MKLHGIDLLVSQNIRRRRLAGALPLKAIASQLDVSTQMASRIERGDARVQASKLLSLARLFSCSVDDLFEGVNGEFAQQPVDRIPHLRALIQSAERINDDEARAALAAVARALAEASVATRQRDHLPAASEETDSLP